MKRTMLIMIGLGLGLASASRAVAVTCHTYQDVAPRSKPTMVS